MISRSFIEVKLKVKLEKKTLLLASGFLSSGSFSHNARIFTELRNVQKALITVNSLANPPSPSNKIVLSSWPVLSYPLKSSLKS